MIINLLLIVSQCDMGFNLVCMKWACKIVLLQSGGIIMDELQRATGTQERRHARVTVIQTEDDSNLEYKKQD